MTLPYPTTPSIYEDIKYSLTGMMANLNYLKNLAEGEFKVIYTTKNMTTDGAESITGVGFLPKAAIIMALESTLKSYSHGLIDPDGTDYSIYKDYDDNYARSNNAIQLLQASGKGQEATYNVWESDGVSLTWAKTGAPTGTATLLCVFIK